MIVDAICTCELFEAAVELNNGNGFNLGFVDADGGCCGRGIMCGDVMVSISRR